MADYSKILNVRDKRLASGEILPDSLLNDILKYPALTDELAAESLLVKYPYQFPGVESEETEIPSYQSVIGLLGLKDEENGRTALDQFINDFPKKQEAWKKKALKKDSTLGERGWLTVKKIWQQAANDKMNADIEKERREIMDGRDGAFDKFASVVGGIVAPRIKQAGIEGRDPTTKEILMDAAQNAAFAIPMGGAEAAIARGLLGSTAGKVAGTVGAAAIAPSAITALDYGLGTKDYAGLEDAVIDAGIGTAANLGVNRVLAPGIGKLINVGRVSGRTPKWLRDFLEDNTSPKQKGLNLVNEAKTKIKLHNNESDAEYLDKLVRGKTPDRLTPEQLQNYSDIIDVGKLAKNPKAVDEFTEGVQIVRDLSKSQPGRKTGIEDIIDETFVNGAPEYLKRAIKKNPELIALMEKRGLKDYVKDPYTYVDVLKSYLTNQYGDDAAAMVGLSGTNISLKDLRKYQDKERKTKKATIAASEILGGSRGPLSAESEMFIEDIRKNPGIMLTGHPDPAKRDAFKIWLLKEGNDLLRGTAAARPTFEVK